MKLRNLLACVFALVIGASLIFAESTAAQTSNGTLVGTVTDKTGGVIVGATVKVTSVDRGGEAPRRTGTRHAMIVPYGAYPTAGGEQVMLAVQSDAEWVRFCATVLEDPGLTRDERFATNERRVTNRAALEEHIHATFDALDRPAVIERLDRAGIASARVNPIEQLATHEQLATGDRWATTGTEAGPVRTVLPPWLPPGRAEDLGDVPALGQHTQAVLDWLGDGGA